MNLIKTSSDIDNKHYFIILIQLFWVCTWSGWYQPAGLEIQSNLQWWISKRRDAESRTEVNRDNTVKVNTKYSLGNSDQSPLQRMDEKQNSMWLKGKISCWREWGEKGTLLYCWWECKSVQPLWRFLKKTKYRSTYRISSHNSNSWHITRENHNSKRYMHFNVYCNTIHQNQDKEAS